MKNYRDYSANDKATAISLVVVEGLTLKDAEKKTGIPFQNISRWVRDANLKKPQQPKKNKAPTKRLNVDLPEDFFRKIKTKAASEGETIQSVVTALLKDYVGAKNDNQNQ